MKKTKLNEHEQKRLGFLVEQLEMDSETPLEEILRQAHISIGRERSRANIADSEKRTVEFEKEKVFQELTFCKKLIKELIRGY